MGKLLLAILLVCTIMVGFSGLTHAQEELFGDVCDSAPESPVCKDQEKAGSTNADNPIAGPEGIIQDAADIVAMVTGIIAVVMIVASGLMFITAGGTGFKSQSGTPTKAAKARSMLMYSVVGLVVVAAAWTIITFVNNNLVNT
ncbi:hypothetical protein A3F38_02130 [Candidatus Saccharibacteria bacterium RIFCSPHIGHO2_12_FULL_48_21]|nr:MAG: hypothetical protein A3F38_02130 [Candidatus Saccharibacteria bacterium RIFCSPHIGHO2_12_FULL_48_21]